ncbi:hypothetical protein [uncultured Lutibacter sp.]|uniref:hypothetical protein n=1 Tax=uncultured Lutibacter sp. TaxID=437739 RepID=UPI00260C4779|nr:hypothetical protein [uncultured Lutibacter sp.]
MKKIFYYILTLGFIFTACEPMEDIYDDIDGQAVIDPRATIGSDEYTLTDDDYDALNLNYGSFSSLDDAKSMLPGLLSDNPKYEFWQKNSSVLVNYKLYIGNAFSVKDYNLKLEDYALSGSDLLGFKADATPEDYLADIVSANYDYLKEGDYVNAHYYQYTGSAYVVSPTVSFEDNLDYGASTGDITTISGGNWINHSGASNQLAYSTESLSMANYPSSNIGGAIEISSSGSEDINSNFSSIITSGKVYSSALINISEVGDGTYFFHLMEEDGSYNYSARVGAKSDGSGNVLFGIGATSSSLTYGETAFSLNTTYLIVASYDIATGTSNLYVLTEAVATEPLTPEATSSGNSGNSANRIGIRQGGGGPTAVIDGIRVANTWSAIMSNGDLDDEVIGTKVEMETILTYDGNSWVSPSENFYALSEADFESMGISNFGSASPAAYPEDYLPTFLNLKFPYAQEDTALNVAYKYVSSSSGAQTRGNLYTKTNGVWIAYQSTISTSLQFGFDGSTWVPDNTIKYTLVRNDDYEYMASQLTGDEYAGLIGNLAKYGDFDYKWTDAQITYALSLFLDYLDPTAEEGQKYILTYVVYDNGENEFSKNFIKQNGAWVINE